MKIILSDELIDRIKPVIDDKVDEEATKAFKHSRKMRRSVKKISRFFQVYLF